jgi:hypothetical protein
MRCLKVEFSAELIDAVLLDDIHTPDDYTTSRIFGAKVKKVEEAGIQYRSVRNKGAVCWGLMSPVHVESAVQTQHFEFVFDGQGISKVRELTM